MSAARTTVLAAVIGAAAILDAVSVVAVLTVMIRAGLTVLDESHGWLWGASNIGLAVIIARLGGLAFAKTETWLAHAWRRLAWQYGYVACLRALPAAPRWGWVESWRESSSTWDAWTDMMDPGEPLPAPSDVLDEERSCWSN